MNVPSDPHRDVGRLAPPGWVIRRHAERQWWVFRDQRAVAQVGVMSTGEWWVCPDGDPLPWGTTYSSAAEAVEALVRWWAHTHPFA